MTRHIFHTFIILGALSLKISPSVASYVVVANENKKTLEIEVSADADSAKTTVVSYKHSIPPEYFYDFQVTPDFSLHGEKKFSIKGATSSISFTGNCRGLDTDNDYFVIFADNPIGTECVARKIQK